MLNEGSEHTDLLCPAAQPRAEALRGAPSPAGKLGLKVKSIPKEKQFKRAKLWAVREGSRTKWLQE